MDEARRVFSSRTFDFELGWDKDPLARGYVATKPYFAQSYGDSFVWGGEVGPEDTWQAHFERLTGKGIVNLGVSGYGLDQAVLKFEKYAGHYPSRIAILGLYHQTYRRALSYYSFYYFGDPKFMFVFKPIFIKRDGRFELIRLPCKDAACLLKILSNPNHELWQWLASNDYWYQNNLQKPVRGFPNTIKYLSVAQQLLRNRRELQGEENYFFVNSLSLELVKYLTDRFVKQGREMGSTPICVLLYSPFDLQLRKAGIRHDNELLKFLVRSGIRYLDTGQYILDHYQDDDRFDGIRAPGGHLNSRGNAMVAESLVQGLASMGLLPH